MNHQPLISIIIPVYNSEPFLEKTINCIREQTYQNLEIILINDGSTDNSGNICDKLALLDSRIIVIHKSNEGISKTRNKGLDRATGEYIAFCDNDDIIHPQMVEFLYKGIIEQHTLLSMCHTFSTSNDNIDIKIHKHNFTTKKLSQNYLLSELYQCSSFKWHINTNVVYNKLYSRELIKNIRFTDNGYEDTCFCNKIYCTIEEATFVDLPLYNWIIRSSSKSHYTAFDDYKYLALYTHLKNYYYLKDKNIAEEIQAKCLYRLYKTLLSGRFYSKNTPYENKTKRVCKYINKEIGLNFFFNKHISLISRLAIFLFLNNSILYTYFLRIAPKFIKND